MNERDGQLDWNFALQWLLAVAVGGTVAALLATFVAWRLGPAAEDLLGETASALITGGLYGAILALGIGLGSGLLLQKRGISARRWTVATVLAGAAGMAIAFTFALTFPGVEAMSEVVAGLVIGLSLGLPFGVAQAIVLRQHEMPATGWGVVVVLASLIGLSAGLPLGGEGRELLAVVTMALLFAAVTGLGMTWQVRQETTAAS